MVLPAATPPTPASTRPRRSRRTPPTGIDQDVWQYLVALVKRSSDGGAAARKALREIPPEEAKKLLLRHARACTDTTCETCEKLRKRIDSVKRKRHLWRRFRIIGMVAGRTAVKLARAAERAYAPGAAGFAEAQEHFDATWKAAAEEQAPRDAAP